MRSLLRHKIASVLVLIETCVFVGHPVFAYTSPGKASGYVNDFAHVLSDDQASDLTSQVHLYKERSTNEIAVVTVPTTGDESIEQYAVQLFQEWGIGQKQRDNGVLILAAIQDRKIRIEVGYGLEPILTDTKSAQIITHAKPLLNQEKYSEALKEITQEIITTIDTGEPSFFPTDPNTYDANTLDKWGDILAAVVVGFMLLIFIIPVTWAIITGIKLNRRGKGWQRYSGTSNSSSISHSTSSSSSSNSSHSTDSFGGGSSGGGGASGSW